MKWLFCIFIAGVALGCGKDDAKPKGNKRNPAMAPLNYLESVGKSKRKLTGDAGMLQMNQALAAFKASEGRAPKSLQELITAGYLAALPQLSPGEKWEYNQETGQASIGRIQ